MSTEPAIEHFEREYAKRSNTTVRELHAGGRFGGDCNCGEKGCEGFQMMHLRDKLIAAGWTPACPLGQDPLDGADCHLCGGTADTFWVSDDLWQRVGLSGQVCFRCFRVGAWHVEVRPDTNWFVSL
jgi:hypothetical protein